MQKNINPSGIISLATELPHPRTWASPSCRWYAQTHQLPPSPLPSKIGALFFPSQSHQKTEAEPASQELRQIFAGWGWTDCLHGGGRIHLRFWALQGGILILLWGVELPWLKLQPQNRAVQKTKKPPEKMIKKGNLCKGQEDLRDYDKASIKWWQSITSLELHEICRSSW